MTDLTVSRTILQQMGGNRFIVMTGSYNFIGSDDSLTMKLRTNKAKATHLRVTLMPSDTYKMEFLNCRKFEVKVKTIKTVEDVYCDQLQDIFTEVTGLFTRM